MFKPRDSEGTAQSGTARGGAQLLTHAQIVAGPAAELLTNRITRRHAFADRAIALRDRIDQALARVDFAPDLAQNIGSFRWFRGVTTLFGLSAVALMAWPSWGSLEAAPPMQIDASARDEFRSQMIMPLGLGADSGRRMAATSAVVPLQSAPERPRIDLVATLAQGDSFTRMLQRAGVSSDEARELSVLVGGTMPLDEIRPGTKVDIVLGRRPSAGAARPLETMAFRARFDLELGIERRNGLLTVDPRPIAVDTTPLRIRGAVGSSLYRSARAAGAPASAVQKYLRTLGEYVDLDRGIRSGDEFDLIVSYKRAATGETEAGDLLYAGVIRDGEPKTQLMRWGKEGRFFEASGVGEMRSGLVAPVPGRIGSGYGMRKHPILGYRRMHRGLDFKASYGTPIHAVTDGTVRMAGRNGGHGNYVKLDHGSGLATGYSHMSRIAVNNGQRVRRGQVIGYVGSTGLSTGPHLHYEMYRNGQTVDPRSVKFVTRAELTGAELRAFRGQLADLLKVEPGQALAPMTVAGPASEEPAREIDRVDQPKRVN